MKKERKIRKQIYLDLEHDVLLKAQAAHFRVSEAEIIRRSLKTEEPGEVAVPLASQELWEEELRYLKRRLAESHASKKGAPTSCRTWKREDLYDR